MGFCACVGTMTCFAIFQFCDLALLHQIVSSLMAALSVPDNYMLLELKWEVQVSHAIAFPSCC